MTNLNNQSGRSMIEMLGVLAIIGVLSVGGIAGYSKAMLKFRTNKTIDQFTMIVTNIRTLYAQQRDYDGLDNSTAISMGIIPDEMITKCATEGGCGTVAQGSATGALVNPFNGSVEIGTGNSTGATDGTGRSFHIRINGLPREACLNMAVNDWGSNYSSGLIAMTTGTNNDAPIDADGSASTMGTAGCTDAVDAAKICAAKMPLEVATATTYCACASNTCSLAFKYY